MSSHEEDGGSGGKDDKGRVNGDDTGLGNEGEEGENFIDVWTNKLETAMFSVAGVFMRNNIATPHYTYVYMIIDFMRKI